MKKRFLIIISMVLIALLLSSCAFVESNLEYINSTEDVMNTIYTVSIVGLTLFLWGKEF